MENNSKKIRKTISLSIIKAHALDDQLMCKYICTCNISSLITDNVQIRDIRYAHNTNSTRECDRISIYVLGRESRGCDNKLSISRKTA